MNDLRGSSARSYVDLPWGQVHLRSAGDPADPTLLMLHQSPLSSATFEPALQPLANLGLRVIAIDTPGFGLSDPTPEAWSIRQYAGAVWQVADALDLDTLTVLGQHTGATIACEAAIQRPGAVNGLVLQGLPIYSSEEREEKVRSYAPGYVPTLDGSHLGVIWDRIRGLYPESNAEECTRQVLEYLATGPDYATAYRAVFDYDLDPIALREFPIALVHGDRDLVDRFTPAVTATLPWAELDIVTGTDFAPSEHPGEFSAAVARWTLRFAAGAFSVTAAGSA